MNLKTNTFELIDDIYYKVTDGQGRSFFIDKEDFPVLQKKYWRVTKLGYVINKELGMLHRLIMNTPENMEVDHIDHCGTNNRRNNLRNLTHKENCWNFKAKKTTSKTGCKGISFVEKSNKYRAVIYSNGKRKHLGMFDSLQEAIDARVNAEEEMRKLVTSDWGRSTSQS